MMIKYINHNGTEFVLNGDGLTFVDDMPLHSYEWSYTLTNRVTGMGGIASNFARWPRTFNIEVRLRGYSKQQFIDQVNALHSVIDVDCVDEQPGRLYVDDQYMVCYLGVAGGTPTHPKTGNFAMLELTVLAVEPYWCTEATTRLGANGSGEAIQVTWDNIYIHASTAADTTLLTRIGTIDFIPMENDHVYSVTVPDGLMYTVRFYSGQTQSTYLSSLSGWQTETVSVTKNDGNYFRVYVRNEENTNMDISEGNNVIILDSTYDSTGKKYNYNYGYRYGTGLSAGSIINDHYAAAPAIIKIYGPASNPNIIIGNNTYNVNVILTATDYLVIDQVTHEIYKVAENGTRTNVFNSRNKAYDIFKPIAVGENHVVYSGEYSIEITMVQQRSELLWTE